MIPCYPCTIVTSIFWILRGVWCDLDSATKTIQHKSVWKNVSFIKKSRQKKISELWNSILVFFHRDPKIGAVFSRWNEIWKSLSWTKKDQNWVPQFADFFLPRFFVFEKDFILILSAKPSSHAIKVALYSHEMSQILSTFCFKMEYRADFAWKGCLNGAVHPEWLVSKSFDFLNVFQSYPDVLTCWNPS